MQFSLSVEYAIHGMVFLATSARDGAVLVGDVARATAVPESYLRKVFQLLAKARLVASQRGARGGFTLARPASEITLADVVEAIDGSLPFYACARATRGCSLGEECPVSAAFGEARKKMAEVLGATTIAGLSKKITRRRAAWLKVGACPEEDDNG
jgi:Rrf2 family transcriptional regulator, iron-sulfur cluster assembly transcription factor